MSYPSYREIEILEPSIDKISEIIQELNVGHIPIYFNLLKLQDTDKEEAIQNIYSIYKLLRHSFTFPYPTYIVSNVRCNDIPIIQIASIDMLPKFYKLKIKKLTVKEQEAARKNELNAKLFLNNTNSEKQQLLIELSPLQQKLKLLLEINDFYAEVE